MYVPVSTYRLQLHAGFPFAAATEVAGYLARLGVGACYTSPYTAAMPGSTHGYDVADHNEINPELGGREAFDLWTARLRELGLGHLVDFVPNHMGITTGAGANLRWRDVLENGPSAAAAHFFDVDWTPIKSALHSKILLPILGDQYGRVLERGELALQFRDGLLLVSYFEHELPVNPKCVPSVLRLSVGPLTASLGADSPQLHEFLSILTSLQNLPAHTVRDPALGGRTSAREGSGADATGAAGRRIAGRSSSRSTPRSARSTASPVEPTASTGCTSCSRRSRTACRTGAPRRTRSTTAGSSTSTPSPACGSKTTRSSPRRTSC